MYYNEARQVGKHFHADHTGVYPIDNHRDLDDISRVIDPSLYNFLKSHKDVGHLYVLAYHTEAVNQSSLNYCINCGIFLLSKVCNKVGFLRVILTTIRLLQGKLQSSLSVYQVTLK